MATINERELLGKAARKDGLTISMEQHAERSIANRLVAEGLLKSVRIISPFHDCYAITRKGKAVLQTGQLDPGDQFLMVPYHPGMRIKYSFKGFDHTGTIELRDNRRRHNLNVRDDDGTHWWISEADVLQKLTA